jgi:cytochrome b561
MLLNSPKRYGAVATTLHWLIAAAIIFQLMLGLWMTSLLDTDPLKFSRYQLHKSIGLTILVLSVARLLWRLINVVPPLPQHMPMWERWAAHASHFLLYTLMIMLPLSGWARVSTDPIGIPTLWFGAFEVPPMPGLTPDEAITDALHETHELFGYAMIALLLVHVGAALKHHFWDRDTVFRRILPFANVD